LPELVCFVGFLVDPLVDRVSLIFVGPLSSLLVVDEYPSGRCERLRERFLESLVHSLLGRRPDGGFEECPPAGRFGRLSDPPVVLLGRLERLSDLPVGRLWRPSPEEDVMGLLSEEERCLESLFPGRGLVEPVGGPLLLAGLVGGLCELRLRDTSPPDGSNVERGDRGLLELSVECPFFFVHPNTVGATESSSTDEES
jgi:hypothetical protein